MEIGFFPQNKKQVSWSFFYSTHAGLCRNSRLIAHALPSWSRGRCSSLPGPDYFDEVTANCLNFARQWGHAPFGKILTNYHQFCLPGKIIRSPQCFLFDHQGKFGHAEGILSHTMLRTKTFRSSGCNPHSRWCTTGPLNLVMRKCRSLATCTYLSISPSGTFQASETPFAPPRFFFFA